MDDGAVHVVRIQLCDFGLHSSNAFDGKIFDVVVVVTIGRM